MGAGKIFEKTWLFLAVASVAVSGAVELCLPVAGASESVTLFLGTHSIGDETTSPEDRWGKIQTGLDRPGRGSALHEVSPGIYVPERDWLIEARQKTGIELQSTVDLPKANAQGPGNQPRASTAKNLLTTADLIADEHAGRDDNPDGSLARDLVTAAGIDRAVSVANRKVERGDVNGAADLLAKIQLGARYPTEESASSSLKKRVAALKAGIEKIYGKAVAWSDTDIARVEAWVADHYSDLVLLSDAFQAGGRVYWLAAEPAEAPQLGRAGVRRTRREHRFVLSTDGRDVQVAYAHTVDQPTVGIAEAKLLVERPYILGPSRGNVGFAQIVTEDLLQEVDPRGRVSRAQVWKESQGWDLFQERAPTSLTFSAQAILREFGGDIYQSALSCSPRQRVKQRDLLGLKILREYFRSNPKERATQSERIDWVDRLIKRDLISENGIGVLAFELNRGLSRVAWRGKCEFWRDLYFAIANRVTGVDADQMLDGALSLLVGLQTGEKDYTEMGIVFGRASGILAARVSADFPAETVVPKTRIRRAQALGLIEQIRWNGEMELGERVASIRCLKRIVGQPDSEDFKDWGVASFASQLKGSGTESIRQSAARYESVFETFEDTMNHFWDLKWDDMRDGTHLVERAWYDCGGEPVGPGPLKR